MSKKSKKTTAKAEAKAGATEEKPKKKVTKKKSKPTKKVAKADKKAIKKEEKKSKKKEKKEKAHVPVPRVDKDGNLTLNEHEALTLRFVKKHKEGVSLRVIADKIFAKRAGKSKEYDKAHSWARNSVRKPVRAGLLIQTDRGVYNLTKLGRKAI